tara:strand:- start:128 stop:727 length:600 start_codon:yes stop_codon:yes gene_type:complete
MRKLLLILILTFSFQSWTKADDIRDFELEEISIGDSLLIHLKRFNIDKDSLKKNRFYYSGSKKFYGTRIVITAKNAQYDNIGFLLKEKDNKYIIYILTGRKTFSNDLAGCTNDKEKIVNDFISLLKNTERVDYTYSYPRDDGKSISYITDFNFQDGSAIRVYCTNWSSETEKKMKWKDSLSISISSAEGLYWLNNESGK